MAEEINKLKEELKQSVQRQQNLKNENQKLRLKKVNSRISSSSDPSLKVKIDCHDGREEQLNNEVFVPTLAPLPDQKRYYFQSKQVEIIKLNLLWK